MRRLHVTIVLIGALVLVGSLVVATSILPGGTPDNGTAAAPTGQSATPTATGVETTPAGPPTVQVLGHDDGAAVTNPFGDREWTETDIYVHVGGDQPNQNEPVAVLVLNNGSEQTLPVHARHRPSNTTLFDRSPTFATAEALVFVFHEPSTYAVEVTADNGTETVALQRSDFDCNERTMGVAAEPGGTTVSQSVSTMLGCETV